MCARPRPRISSAVLGFSVCATLVAGCGSSKQTTGPEPDTVPPTLTVTTPAQGATDVATNTLLTATFSEAMDAATVNASTFTLKRADNTPVSGTVTCVAATATFSPGAGLDGATGYIATLSTEVSDVAGNHLAEAYSWGFTTGAAPDTTSPRVLTTSPADAAVDVDPAAHVTVTFSEAMNPALINTTTFSLKDVFGGLISGVVTYDAVTNTAAWTPASPLAPVKTYTATMSRNATDLAGNLMWHDKVWSFTTRPPLVSFATGNRYPGGTPALVSDVNGDGALDLLISGSPTSNGTLGVRFGEGSGGFGSLQDLAVGALAGRIAIADVNADSRPDLLVSHYDFLQSPAASYVGVLLGDGAGGFGPESPYPTGDWPRGVVARDFNQDGKVDLVTPNWWSGDVSLLLGAGTGGFSAPQSIPVGMLASGMAVEDFNRDGRPDLAVSGDGGLRILLASGAGSFGTPVGVPAGPGVLDVVAKDLDGDGALDLIVPNGGGDFVTWLKGDGAGSFGPGGTVGVARYPHSVDAADLNGDGVQDLIVSTLVNGGVGVNALHALMGLGDGVFAAPSTVYTVNTNYVQPPGVKIGDFNSDGKPDLAVSNDDTHEIVIFLNTSP